jgi:hypothetical protein
MELLFKDFKVAKRHKFTNRSFWLFAFFGHTTSLLYIVGNTVVVAVWVGCPESFCFFGPFHVLLIITVVGCLAFFFGGIMFSCIVVDLLSFFLAPLLLLLESYL